MSPKIGAKGRVPCLLILINKSAFGGKALHGLQLVELLLDSRADARALDKNVRPAGSLLLHPIKSDKIWSQKERR